MSELRISDLVKRTGFKARYWQRRVAAGEVPGAQFVIAGKRRIFVIDEAQFTRWWERQKCPVISAGAGPSGGIASPKPERRTKARWKQTASPSLKTALKELSAS